MSQAPTEAHRIPADALRAFCARVLSAVGMPEDDAAVTADILVETDLRGIESHGVTLLPRYVKRMRIGITNPRPNVRVVGGRGAVAVVDGDFGMGHVVGHFAMRHAIALAKEHATSTVVVRRSVHYGIAGYYALMAARENLIGYSTTNAGADMVAAGGIDPVLGNNPVAYAFPAGRHAPVVLDMATSVAAYGKVRMLQMKGKTVPPGWVVGDVSDPEEAMRTPILPAGGYKGSGLAFVNEIFNAVLSGALLSVEARRTPAPAPDERRDPRGIGHVFSAWDIEAFVPLDEFRRRVDQLIDEVKASRPAPGVDEVLVPGEIEQRARDRNVRDGVPLAAAVVEQLANLARMFSIPMP